jgi:predicted O-methyltransferase YrrM
MEDVMTLATRIKKLFMARLWAIDNPRPVEAGHFQRYMRSCSSIPGWFPRESIAVWDCLLSYQASRRLPGNLLEIGVYKGRSAVLAAMHAQTEEVLILVDMLPMACAYENVSSIKRSNVIYLEAKSQDLRHHPVVNENARRCRWIHIDGEHSESAVTSDLELASGLLSEDGVISLDDFLSPGYPQITRAVFRYLESHENEVSLFLCGFNKGYLCRRGAKQAYLSYIATRGFLDMAERDCRSVTFWKTNLPEEINCFGVSGREQDYDYRGLDFDHTKIVT